MIGSGPGAASTAPAPSLYRYSRTIRESALTLCDQTCHQMSTERGIDGPGPGDRWPRPWGTSHQTALICVLTAPALIWGNRSFPALSALYGQTSPKWGHLRPSGPVAPLRPSGHFTHLGELALFTPLGELRSGPRARVRGVNGAPAPPAPSTAPAPCCTPPALAGHRRPSGPIDQLRGCSGPPALTRSKRGNSAPPGPINLHNTR
jgi:hypothetical protein